MDISGLLFDKDGTLFDFRATWNGWTMSVIDHFSNGQQVRAQSVADAIDFDLKERGFRPTSPVIAGTNREVAELIGTAVPDFGIDEIETYLAVSAGSAPLAPVVPLTPLFNLFQSKGMKLGVVTNDSIQSADAHLASAGVTSFFDFVAGYDSGYGAKPDPDPLLAFAKQVQLPPSQIAMVGDSSHDLIAGRRAGMKTIGVLTGMAGQAELEQLADVVLPHIGEIPNLLNFA